MAIIANWKMRSDGTDSVWGYNGSSTITYWVGWPTWGYGIFTANLANFVNIPDNNVFSSTNQVFSTSLWFYEWNTNNQWFIMCKWAPGQWEWWMSKWLWKTNALKYRLWWSSWYSSLWTPVVLSNNKWVHIINSWNNTYPIIYVNGIAIPTTIYNTDAALPQNGTSSITIGKRNDGYAVLWRIANVTYRDNFITAWMAKSEYIFFKWFY